MLIEWTSMFALAKQVLFKYKSLVMKMVKDILGNALIANTNDEFLKILTLFWDRLVFYQSQR